MRFCSIDTISKSFDWKNDAIPKDLANKANQWLDEINIPTEKRPEIAKCKYVSLTRGDYEKKSVNNILL